jgi:hypothetical protein
MRVFLSIIMREGCQAKRELRKNFFSRDENGFCRGASPSRLGLGFVSTLLFSFIRVRVSG